ncbi:MAG TPA: SOS response-associated peptidase [Acidimicrobiia bacterium]|nr:SOS response-associated peptidase [Acidimicrobiia bacterium]
MCGRFVTASSPQLLVDRFGVDDDQVGDREPDYNVTPRAVVPVVRERPPRRDAEPGPTRRVLSELRWGLVPSWAESPAIGDRMINARAETVATTKSYQRAFRRRRCIVPADAFYEWKKLEAPGTKKPVRQPWVVRRRDGEPLAFAGLWEIWRDESIDDPDDPAAWLRTYAIVTTRANELLARVHDRMPVVLDEGMWDQWLDPAFDDVATLQSFLEPAPQEWFETFEVSSRVNSPANNDADLLRPVGV